MRSMMKSSVLVATLLAASVAPAVAQDDDNDGIWEIGDFTCRDLLMRGGEDRDFVMVFMHGYMSGKLGEMTFDAPALTEATDVAVGACIDDPDQPLMEAFESARN